MNDVVKKILSIVYHNTKTMYALQLENGVVKELPKIEIKDVTKYKKNQKKPVMYNTISGIVTENSIQMILNCIKDRIRDFVFGEFKLYKTKIVSEKYKIEDKNGNPLRFLSDNEYTYLTDNGDIRIIPLCSMSDFKTKIDTIYMPICVGDNQEDKTFGTIVNVLKYSNEGNDIIEKEYEFIFNNIASIDTANEKECQEFQDKIRKHNDIVVVKKFRNEKLERYDFNIMFKFKPFIKLCEILIVEDKDIKTVFKDAEDEKNKLVELYSNNYNIVHKNNKNVIKRKKGIIKKNTGVSSFKNFNKDMNKCNTDKEIDEMYLFYHNKIEEIRDKRRNEIFELK